MEYSKELNAVELSLKETQCVNGGSVASGVKIVGRVKNGKVEFDSASMAKLNTSLPGADVSCVAVNAPFRTKDMVSAPVGA